MHNVANPRSGVFTLVFLVFALLTILFVDHGFANGVLYDDFSERIDRMKWTDLDFVRRVENGQLVSALTRFGASGSNDVNFVNPSAINAIQADVTVTAVDLAGANPRAQLSGTFYNDGTPGTGRVGDVSAEVTMRHNGTALVGTFVVRRCTNGACTSIQLLTFDTTFGPVAVGETHTLSLAWDGRAFTFGFDGQAVTIDPTAAAPVVGPRGDSCHASLAPGSMALRARMKGPSLRPHLIMSWSMGPSTTTLRLA